MCISGSIESIRIRIKKDSPSKHETSHPRKTAAFDVVKAIVNCRDRPVFEHRVVVLPDDTINEKLPGQDWQEVCDVIVAGMKSNQPAQALESAIARCGEILGKPLPRQDEDVNELGNELILID